MDGLLRELSNSGVMDECRAKTKKLLLRAETTLARLPDHPSRQLLIDIARVLSDRNA
jgi:hypothetical protein